MSAAQFDVVGVGNAIVDLLHAGTDQFLAAHAIAKGGMTLIDEERALYLTELFSDPVLAAGGSAANTLTGLASLGGKGAFIGKVADDSLGARFTQAFGAAGVHFSSPPRVGPPGTARCLIVVTPDGQRSMSTYLGASTLLDEKDVDEALIAASGILFLEGYLFDREEAKAAFVKAAEIAARAARKTALTLSDRFCVDRHRDSFRHLVKGHVDVLFANESEILGLYETEDFDAALKIASEACPLVVVTRSEKGAAVLFHGARTDVAAFPVAKVVDTTGAGDQFAAGFLFGLAHGRPMDVCAKLGALAAAEVISHMGPRPETSLAALAATHGLL